MSEEQKYSGRGAAPKPWDKTTIIGKRIPRVDAYERVSGSAVYPSDVTFPDMLYGAVLRCPWACAKVRSVDTSGTEKMEGVYAVISGWSPEAGIYWPYSKDIRMKLFDPLCRYEGEPVAAVAATTPYLAWDAIRSIKVEYDRLPFVADERKALDDGAPHVHEIGNLVTPTQVYQRGDVAKGFAEADVVLEETYRTECEIHTPMELHGCVARWDRDRLTLWESTQGVYAVQARVSEILGLPLSKVRVIGHYMGGAFGSKLQPGKYTIIAAVLAKMTARPVKLFLTREETFLAAGNRPPANMRLKAGVRKDGRLTALHFTDIGTGGAYPAGGTAFVDWLAQDLYACPNVKTELTDVYINAGPSRPFRAPGHPQGSWALEQMMDALAVAIKMDPVEVRLKNIPLYSQARPGNPPYTTTGLRECLTEGAKAFKWDEARRKTRESGKEHIRRGIGMAGALWAVGGGRPPSTVIVKIFADGSVNLNMGASDIGTGTKTIMAMVVAEELGVKLDAIQIENADTGTTQYATPSGGSKTVPTESPAVRAACISVKEQLLQMAAQDLKADVSSLMVRSEEIVSTADASKRIKISGISGLKEQGVIVGIGYRAPNPADKITNPFAAQFCEVEVDTKTGEVKILRFVGANDSGRVMDRLTYDNQVFGGITMGIGLAMTEARILDAGQTGKMLNRNWHDYKIPTALDVPAEMVSVPLDLPDPEANTTGAKGLGEPVTIPTAPAVANAIYNATGVRVTTTGMTPVQLCELFARAKQPTKQKREG
ncbi:MAG TPA: xanthine dehydrogenase family protein molybdopterin-binding subunit [Syntrophorhabdales bacterium]|nr:xanthine dehydrogenase family protein molybdopterin-binding subunit [Syntrophorhabdales bacterium]